MIGKLLGLHPNTVERWAILDRGAPGLLQRLRAERYDRTFFVVDVTFAYDPGDFLDGGWFGALRTAAVSLRTTTAGVSGLRRGTTYPRSSASLGRTSPQV
ncbi:hypothetical protein OG884_08630 [Streptosporangium sp. NBC_01755]|uniref:hypothetical protein n=1 Tax=unclassified Streptosporangium TaxID=2632669 RepID=UPI002DD7A6C7|nr:MULTISPECIES: hypothetical protein [unclassified Streptosporangium]WSA26610.1 hypothetical protein OIE13_01530 [Streptosporangium sp. NBC_01810]WSD01966.1 hypothetical protein OG884_08630 [Streptosporangium sp. NBC_01755]